jgi:hypothetical protein
VDGIRSGLVDTSTLLSAEVVKMRLLSGENAALSAGLYVLARGVRHGPCGAQGIWMSPAGKHRNTGASRRGTRSGRALSVKSVINSNARGVTGINADSDEAARV